MLNLFAELAEARFNICVLKDYESGLEMILKKTSLAKHQLTFVISLSRIVKTAGITSLLSS